MKYICYCFIHCLVPFKYKALLLQYLPSNAVRKCPFPMKKKISNNGVQNISRVTVLHITDRTSYWPKLVSTTSLSSVAAVTHAEIFTATDPVHVFGLNQRLCCMLHIREVLKSMSAAWRPAWLSFSLQASTVVKISIAQKPHTVQICGFLYFKWPCTSLSPESRSLPRNGSRVPASSFSLKAICFWYTFWPIISCVIRQSH